MNLKQWVLGWEGPVVKMFEVPNAYVCTVCVLRFCQGHQAHTSLLCSPLRNRDTVQTKFKSVSHRKWLLPATVESGCQKGFLKF